MAQTHILYHSPCTDGFAAAFAAWLSLGTSATYHPMKYGQAIPAEIKVGDSVIMLDYSIPRADADALNNVVDLVVIDHHKTALADLFDAGYAHIDMNHSGAVLTWQWFHGMKKPVPPLLRYVEDRDLWNWKLPNSREVSAALRIQPETFEHWAKMHRNPDIIEQLRVVGAAILAAQDSEVTAVCRNVRILNIGGYPVPVVNTPLHISEVGERLCETHSAYPFSATYYVQADGKEKWSLRSSRNNGDFDVSALAKVFNGGGHRNAAGFVVHSMTGGMRHD